MSDYRQRLGAEGESLAEKYLRRRGYVILERNYRCVVGEIDLIALDGSVIVFLEVKTRRSSWASPFDSVDRRKQRQIVRTAQYYLARKRLQDRDGRFDVVGITWHDSRPRIELLRNAFDAR